MFDWFWRLYSYLRRKKEELPKPRCPFCGEQLDSSQLRDREWNECPNCGKPFLFTRALAPRDVTPLLHGVYIPRKLPKPGSQAVSKGYGKFFKGKGKHQHKTYRRSVKARLQPEEENDEA